MKTRCPAHPGHELDTGPMSPSLSAISPHQIGSDYFAESPPSTPPSNHQISGSAQTNVRLAGTVQARLVASDTPPSHFLRRWLHRCSGTKRESGGPTTADRICTSL